MNNEPLPLTEGRNPATAAIDSLSTAEIVRLINDEDATVATAVRSQEIPIAMAIDAITRAIQKNGRLIYIGAGTSGRLGVLDASECPPTFSTLPTQVVGLIAGGPKALTTAVEGAEDHPEDAVNSLKSIQLSSADVVVGIASSGRTPYVIGGLRYAQTVEATAIGFACSSPSLLRSVSDINIEVVVGPEVITGSTRLKAGTATKMVLNMLTTGAMIRLGKTYSNLMVDLTATNQKLADRSSRIVCELTGLSRKESEALLARCDGELKTAVVSESLGLQPAEARQRLQRSNGHLRSALSRAPHD